MKRGCFFRNARARNTHVEATLNHPFAAQVDLGPLQDRKVRRIWGKLVKGEKDKSDNISGDVELVLQWRYNPRLDFDPRVFGVFF